MSILGGEKKKEKKKNPGLFSQSAGMNDPQLNC